MTFLASNLETVNCYGALKIVSLFRVTCLRQILLESPVYFCLGLLQIFCQSENIFLDRRRVEKVALKCQQTIFFLY